jgi:hypothetical protein
MGESAAIDVESFEYLQNGFDVNAPRLRPTDDVEIFLTGFQSIENAIEKKSVVDELLLEKPEIATIELNPKAFALQMFQPARTQIAPPMTLDPATYRRFAEIAPGFLAFDPLVTQGFLLALNVNAGLFHGLLPSQIRLFRASAIHNR